MFFHKFIIITITILIANNPNLQYLIAVTKNLLYIAEEISPSQIFNLFKDICYKTITNNFQSIFYSKRLKEKTADHCLNIHSLDRPEDKQLERERERKKERKREREREQKKVRGREIKRE